MAERFRINEHYCPLTGKLITIDMCKNSTGQCAYWRGGSSVGKERTTLCNWPRNGSDIDPNPPAEPIRPPVPDYVLEAFAET